MRALTHFSIPIKGLKNGMHHYQFRVEDDFFKQFEDSLVKRGEFEISVDLIKKSDHIEINFDLTGKLQAECDRCMAPIMLPLDGEYQLIVKYTVDDFQIDEEVWSITYETPDLVLNKAIFEFIVLSVPLVKSFDCEDEEPVPCNIVVRDYQEADEEEPDGGDDENPFSQAFKNLDFNN